MENNLIIAQFGSVTIGLGLIVTLVTQAVKQADTIPWINKIPGIQKIIDQVAAGNVKSVRIFAGVIAIALNIFYIRYNTGVWMDTNAIVSAAGSFFTALGGYNLFFSGVPKNVPTSSIEH